MQSEQEATASEIAHLRTPALSARPYLNAAVLAHNDLSNAM